MLHSIRQRFARSPLRTVAVGAAFGVALGCVLSVSLAATAAYAVGVFGLVVLSLRERAVLS